MTRRALLFALVTAALGMTLVFLYHRSFEQEVSGGPRVRVLAPVKVIPRGTIITDDMITVREVPLAYFEDRMVRDAERAKVVGLRLGNTVPAHQTLTWTDLLTASDERRDLSSLVQPGSRAVSIRTSREDSHIALLRPGDYVDVIATTSGPTPDSRAAAVLLQRVLVLATSSTIPTDVREAKSDGDVLLMLSLTVPEAQLLALAMEKGRLVVALRNPDDPKTSDRLPDVVSTAISDSKERALIKGVRGPARLEAVD
jgi:pilus assembly protein CpaB